MASTLPSDLPSAYSIVAISTNPSTVLSDLSSLQPSTEPSDLPSAYPSVAISTTPSTVLSVTAAAVAVAAAATTTAGAEK